MKNQHEMIEKFSWWFARRVTHAHEAVGLDEALLRGKSSKPWIVEQRGTKIALTHCDVSGTLRFRPENIRKALLPIL